MTRDECELWLDDVESRLVDDVRKLRESAVAEQRMAAHVWECGGAIHPMTIGVTWACSNRCTQREARNAASTARLYVDCWIGAEHRLSAFRRLREERA
jgi:hypothetical protein